MDFSKALIEIKAGKKLTRRKWNGPNQWVTIQRPAYNSKMTLPYIYIKTVAGDLVPWLASQTDLLSDDWEIVND